MKGTLNKVMLVGRLGDDVKMHYFEGGGCLGRFPLATNDGYINKQTGEQIVNTEWHNIVVRNKAAEICEKHLRKGDRLYVEGRLKTRQWQGEDGNQRYTTEIQVVDFIFLSPKKELHENDPGESSKRAENKEMASGVGNEQQIPKDDLPF